MSISSTKLQIIWLIDTKGHSAKYICKWLGPWGRRENRFTSIIWQHLCRMSALLPILSHLLSLLLDGAKTHWIRKTGSKCCQSIPRLSCFKYAAFPSIQFRRDFNTITLHKKRVRPYQSDPSSCTNFLLQRELHRAFCIYISFPDCSGDSTLYKILNAAMVAFSRRIITFITIFEALIRLHYQKF